jgi:hypothetical protein
MSGRYDRAREEFGKGALSWTKQRIVAQLLSREYVFSAAHTDRRDLRGLIGNALELTHLQIPNGWARCANLVFREVRGQAPVVAIVFRREAPEEKDKTLIAYIDQVSGFPMMPNGGDILVDTPDPGFFRI